MGKKWFRKGSEVSKYYFITYITRKLGKEYLESDVIDEHPFNWLSKARSEINHKIILAGWQEISEEEYRMYDGDRLENNPIQSRETTADLNKLEELRPSDQKGLKS
jgi:hypothetical protein